MTLLDARRRLPTAPASPEGPEGQGQHRTGPRPGWLLAVCCTAQFMVILDLSIVNVALPSIQSSLNFSTTELQWVVDAYAIVFAGFLMLGGRASDHFGQRRTFVLALLLFALTSLAGGASVNHQMLIVARGLQGLSGALMAASSLAIITSSFPEGPARHRAIGLWGAMNGAGGAAGTLLGGVITQELSWRWVLLINPPIGVAAAVVAYLVVTERRRDQGAASFDLLGALTLTAGQLVLVYGIVSGGVDGWASASALVPMTIGVGLLAAFTAVERRAASPLIPFGRLSGSLKVSNVIVLLFSASLFPMWYVSSLYLQQVLGLSPLKTGLTFVPMTLAILLGASQAGKLVGRFGVRPVLGAGLLMMAAGMLLFARIGASGSALGFVVLPGVLTAGGIGLSIVPSTIFATQGARRDQAGLASGLVNTSRQAGGGIGLALLISIATEYTSNAIGRNVSVPVSLTDGFRIAYLAGAGLVITALVVTISWGRRYSGPTPAQRRVAVAAVVVVACFAALDFTTAGAPGSPIGAYSTTGAYSFVSAPGLHPPVIQAGTATNLNELAPGYILMANFYDLSDPPIEGQSGPLIINSQLQPVWFAPVPTGDVAANLTAQGYLGHPVLTWWQGVVSNTGDTETGEDVIVNQHYQTVATLRGQDGWVLTMHELVINGPDAWVTASKNVPMDLSKYGGSVDGVLADSAVQEYDIASGKLLYTWDARSHIPLSSSQAPLPVNGFPWDAYHVNSISLQPNGAFVVSMRNTWAAYLVETKTGAIKWQLGGKGSTFKIPADAAFEFQHDVRLLPGGVVTMFDDDCCQITGGGTYLAPAGPSRGLELKLDLSSHTVSPVVQYTHANGYSSAYMGDFQLLPNGNVFVGWGSQPNFSEYTRSGKLLLDASLPGPDLSYRATVSGWTGLPEYPPSGAARPGPHGITVYASWDGATQVASWRVLAGKTASGMVAVAAAPKAGFETQLSITGGPQVFEVQALNAKGRVIGSSRPFAVENG